MRSGPGKFWLIARPVVGLGSGWNITTVRVLPVGSDVGRLVGKWCVMHRNLDTDTGSCRPRLFRSFSFCRHTLHIAVDCKHPADTKLKNLGETLYFGTIALEAQPTGHTFLPITPAWTEETSRSEMVSPGEWPKVSPCRSESLSGHAEDHFWAAERCNDAKIFKPVRKTLLRFGLSESFVI